jgi:[ribosomal protein S18]-alanine N-acetyltransferase
MLTIRRMLASDLDAVLELEREVFVSPWTRAMYLHEMEKREGCYLVAHCDGVLAAYGGTLLLLDEAHVMTLAVREENRRRGLGARLLLELIAASEGMGARFFTLEVRRSNREAIELYTGFGFQIMGERKHYYLDNMENAFIMWTEDVTTPEYRGLLDGLWARYGDVST